MRDQVKEQFTAARRNQILDGAAKVFAEKGFHPATIRDIARATGLASGSIYNYFENKTALLLGIFERMRAAIQLDEATLNLDEMDFRSFLEVYFRYPIMVLKGDNFALFRVVMSEMLVNQDLRQIYLEHILEPTLREGEQLLQQWAERQAIKPANLALTIRAISATLQGLLLQHIMGDSILEAQWEEIPVFLAKLFVDGLGDDQA